MQPALLALLALSVQQERLAQLVILDQLVLQVLLALLEQLVLQVLLGLKVKQDRRDRLVQLAQ